MANAKQGVIDAVANFKQAQQNLNKILNKSINQDIFITNETLDNPALIISDEKIINIIKNLSDLQKLTNSKFQTTTNPGQKI